MDDSIPELLREAWERLKPKIQRNPDELTRRLARRRQGMMQRPPRAWCLAVRAADHRMHPGNAAMAPEDAAYPTEAGGSVHRFERHHVTLTSELLRQLCRPVYLHPWGEPIRRAAKKLGCNPKNLRWAIEHGAFQTRKERMRAKHTIVDHLILKCDQPLDPSSVMRRYPDPVWGTVSSYLGDRVPDGIEQTIERIPIHRFDGRGGSPAFCSWKWVCPGCAETRRTLFYPLPPVIYAGLLDRARADPLERPPEPLPAFACARCHNVLYFTRVNAAAWNHLVSHVSGGLLYGSEVLRPEWFRFERKRPFRPVLNREPSKRRLEVLKLLQEGLSYGKIARRLGVSKSTVNTHARTIYRQMGWKGRKDVSDKAVEVKRTAAQRGKTEEAERSDVS